ncbi:long-chain-acyl-CoA synthetase [Oleiphilus messinensis]|uniref:Long-chain-acyl-CoA synthetase n=1 Tax=Oleiphilus messinensis TaxID=141451 RepID=A0A1Y0ICA4_9GAMM|nr:long-chain-acyl-CoA synthetase [Oleiphilus messinensis]ARU57095.1 long-chain-acyl-CoA synthetase [Oleiphilus messinensis]
MQSSDFVTLNKIVRKLPSLVARLPRAIQGLRISNNTDPMKPVGLGLCVEQAAQTNPGGIAFIYQGRQYSYAEFNAWSNRIAHYLLKKGVQKGDVVAILLENRPELFACVTACAKIGAVNALINTSQRGKVLVHSINLVSPRAAIVGDELFEAYKEVKKDLSVPADGQLFMADTDTLSEPGRKPRGFENLASSVQMQPSSNPYTTYQVFSEDPCFYIYTSGTTGLPKAVVFNHGRFMKAYGAFGLSALQLDASDRMYVTLPFYHATAMAVCWGSVLAGKATLIIARRFSASRFWDEIRDNGATAFGYVGELCRYLMDQPAKPNDLDNKVRLMVGNGLRPSIWKDFKQRFGVDRVMELYGSSEGNIGFTNLLNFDNTVGVSPFPYAIVKYDKEAEAPIRNSKGFMVRADKGEAGLLIGEITPKTPFHGYTDPEKTEKCIFRDVFKKGDAWFNSGDLMRDIGFRHAQFVDRLGDTFRWKGENVSTTEVEHILDGYDRVSETVVYGVEIPNTNGRAGMASIRLECEPGQFDFEGLFNYLKSELPPYAIPVFLRISEGMETTGTFKHKKAPLKESAYHLDKQDNPVYVWLPRDNKYVQLTPEIEGKINNGEYRY